VDGFGLGVLVAGLVDGLGLLLGLLVVLGLALLVALLLVLGVADAEFCAGDVLIIGVPTGLGLRLGLRLGVGLGVGLEWARALAVLAAASDEAELASMISPPLGPWPAGGWPRPPAAAVTWITHGFTGGGGVGWVPPTAPTLPARNMLTIPDETRENPAKTPNAG